MVELLEEYKYDNLHINIDFKYNDKIQQYMKVYYLVHVLYCKQKRLYISMRLASADNRSRGQYCNLQRDSLSVIFFPLVFALFIIQGICLYSDSSITSTNFKTNDVCMRGYCYNM